MMMVVFPSKYIPRVLSAQRMQDFMNGNDIISVFMEFDMKKDDAVF